ncbi:hypothetical protein [Deefgea sp. CFH1-16]|uniref:hypothetical protein n=1 Tax=Deefgea sp. CFH1-16 TaxID=2675457 RepID=UPI0015F71C7C|nr:hypothetical protein [Deefgea sp. CFH1-16]MBM5573548.1 hypothetical protein [Deefgea sp. CFH1-16]
MKVDLAGGYKKAVGESGLSASFIKMHREYKAAWDLLYSDGFVTFSLCILAKSIENIKYPLRRLLR